jgi:hypothetical protein
VTVPNLPAYVPVTLIAERLPAIFPEGMANRTYCTREMAARTVFAMLYVGAVEGADRWLAPKHVYRMTEEQAGDQRPEARLRYSSEALRPGYTPIGLPWYADTTREPIRDETLREGLVAVGAALERKDLPTTSPRPRYALQAGFSALFAPHLSGQALHDAIMNWQRAHLSKGALARIALRRRGAASSSDGVMVAFPNGETRRLAPGPSSEITKAVIETFASQFLQLPVVLWLSESGNKVVARDDALASEIGLKIEADRNLPDIILVDLGPADPLVLFVEVVATDGPVSQRRREALLALSEGAGFDSSRVAFLTAYADRDAPAFKKTVSSLAWRTFAWFASEPHNLVFLREGKIILDRLMTLDPPAT